MAKLMYIALVSLCAITAVQTDMQCYVCTNCATVEDSYIKSCADDTTTPVSADDTTTTASADDTTTTTTEDDTTPTTSVDDTTTTTSVDDTTTTTSVDDTTTITSVDTTTTTTSVDTTTTTTSVDTTTTTTRVDTTTTTTDVDTTTPPRRKRSVSQDTEGCICNGNKCDCSGTYLAALRAGETNSTAAVTYQCYKYTYSDENGTETVNRGCKAVTQNETACTQFNVTSGCLYCTTDKCNLGFSLQISITLLFLAMWISVYSG